MLGIHLKVFFGGGGYFDLSQALGFLLEYRAKLNNVNYLYTKDFAIKLVKLNVYFYSFPISLEQLQG